MIAITRTPRLLVKLPAQNQTELRLQLDRGALPVRVEPLFASIPAGPPGQGMAAAAQWHVVTPAATGPEVNAWDVCHRLTREGFGVAGLPAATFAEPDIEQRWTVGTPVQHALAAARSCDSPDGPKPGLPTGLGPLWYSDPTHSQLQSARSGVDFSGERVRIAHFDTGYDPGHQALPKPPKLRSDLQRCFVSGEDPNDAVDHTTGILTNLGHGTGTLSILAGQAIGGGAPIGGVPDAEVVPVRVANSVVLFQNSAIARAFDYVHQLNTAGATPIHVITMSMGGLASQAWADAVNALYDLGVFIVTAAGNNFGNLPTRFIVYPARFNRVVAACGIMANETPYADLPVSIMAGNYGPSQKMRTAMAGYSPNTPWARLGCATTIDLDGCGTSAATPQVAAAAALWIQKNLAAWKAYSQPWMRVEAVRQALFPLDTINDHLGRGAVRSFESLSRPAAAEAALKKEEPDSASFPLVRVLTGLGAAAPDARQRMLEQEALWISQQSRELEQILAEGGDNPGPAERQRVIELLHDAPGASQALRDALAAQAKPVVAPPRRPLTNLSPADQSRLDLAMAPPVSTPVTRKLRVFAFDPAVGYNTDTLQLNQTTLEIKYEKVEPGPIGEYLEVVDVDPASACCYAPVDLDHPTLLAEAGLAPSESNPRFHQQMVYAVAMKTIAHFERALGRVALWAPRFVKYQRDGKPAVERHYVQRLRIYPHALREQNAFYSPEKKALLLGYFRASETNPGDLLPGGMTFCAVSHDIIAHETTHALLDGLHRYFSEPTNDDVLAFHEAFADIVAIFQHFTVPEALRDQIRATGGSLAKDNLLAQLAVQFGQAMGNSKALRSAIDGRPSGNEYKEATEAHARGAVLVAAVFDAFLDIYRRRAADLIRLATGGTGVLREGDLPHDLVNRLAQEAAKTAGHVLNICIRALDYCPPVDLRFGDYIRAVITADRDLVPLDPWGYRPAFIQGFRRRGIFPENVRNLSSDSLCWERPELDFDISPLFRKLRLRWDLHVNRRLADTFSRRNGLVVHDFFKSLPEDVALGLGFYRDPQTRLNGQAGSLRGFEVHSVRPVRRIGPDGQQKTDLVIEITQSWVPDDGSGKFRGGCTLIVDLEHKAIRYVIRKRVGHPDRMEEQQKYQLRVAEENPAFTYSGAAAAIGREPFAFMHRKPRVEKEAHGNQKAIGKPAV